MFITIKSNNRIANNKEHIITWITNNISDKKWKNRKYGDFSREHFK